MDWLRSEDLKEEKNVTAPIIVIARNSTYGILRQSAPEHPKEIGTSSHRVSVWEDWVL